MKRLEGATTDNDITVTDGDERERAVRQAERYIVNAGLHYDRWQEELHDELFGDRGRLREWAHDHGLVDRLHRLWLEHRPRGEQIEHQQNEDARLRREHRTARERLTTEERERQAAEAEAEIQQIIDANRTSVTAPADDDIPF